MIRTLVYLFLVAICWVKSTPVSVNDEQTLISSLRSVLDKNAQELNEINLQLRHVAWENTIRPHVCAGQATRTNMSSFDSNTILVQIDSSKCKFVRTPLYFTSLGGTRGHLAAAGSTAIYDPTPNGFNVKIRLPSLTAQQILDTAQEFQWTLNWSGILEYEGH
ncbi:unnamed protein product [Rotaria sp. Silwood1]|nr:unnamed protein product [Rotaria sp. Silwood1]